MKIPENMKNAVKYTVAFLSGVSLLAFAGCNPLDQAPTNKFTDDTFWSSADRAQSVVNMAYNQMYSHTKFLDDEALSDNIFEQRGGPDTRTIRTGTANASTGLFESEWKWIYQGIKKQTDVLADAEDEEFTRLKAEWLEAHPEYADKA